MGAHFKIVGFVYKMEDNALHTSLLKHFKKTSRIYILIYSYTYNLIYFYKKAKLDSLPYGMHILSN